ncbi:MAG: DNA primase [Campylobacteraceae bacterium]|nr:DNA primase [Campylobacteraceae bacterium]
MIDEQSIQSLKQRLDVVDVVGHYLELKKSGSAYKCLCPFHNDTSPSLHVSPPKQIYHCFACGAGGDAIKFVMEYEKLTYPEAIEKLARLYNFSLSYTDRTGKRREEKRVLEALNLYYQKSLEHFSDAKNYLKERGIYDSSIEKFGIGYAPSSTESLNFLQEHGFTIHDAKEVGVADIGQNGRPYARFIERITFPIYSPSGKILGFGGRTISGHVAKYVNSPQSKVFNKSYLLYGYNIAKDYIYQENRIIITEGYLDVIMLHQAGFNTSVATLGTALTSEHLPLITRGNPRVILSYDGDNAGIAAALKASRLLSAHGVSGGVVIFADGEDPADMVEKGESVKLAKLFNEPQAFVEFCLERIVKSHDLNDPLARQQALESGKEFLQTLPIAVAQSYQGILADMLGLRETHVKVATPLKNRNAQYLKKSARTNEDVFELTILKTLLNDPSHLDTVLDLIHPSMFKTHQEEFSAILKNELDSPKLRRLMLWEDIKIYEEDELLGALIHFMNSYYHTELERIKRVSGLSYEKKSFLIRKIQHIIFKLRKGELVPYESISTI